MNLVNAFLLAARDHPDKTALRMGGVETSYSDLAKQSARIAGFLLAQGVRPGQRVACWMPNCLEYLSFVFGAWWIGAVAVPLNYLFGANALRHALGDSGAQ